MAEDGKIAAANLAAEIAAALSKQKEDEEIASARTQREQLKNARIDIDALKVRRAAPTRTLRRSYRRSR